ncbi:hypothetical protein VE00_08996 [Pseudogymnoascus sp. WSF 3629]|nr:hypothetical protein VE00_08996 [Pseudogymnoascus sp. WSF 3629]
MIFEKISLNFVFCDLAFETYTSFASAKSSKLMFPSCSKLVQQSQRLVIGKNGGDEIQQHLETIRESSVNRSAFVLVLIDADPDGYVFDDKYLLRGTNGGREAALVLKSELQRELRQTSPNVAELPFILKLYANVDKLREAMFRHGIEEASNLLRDFCRGFCQTGGLSEFIDVGDGKDRADHQIKGVLEHFKENPCCMHIVLGGCHDNGYVCDLDIIKSEGSLQDRITLLKSFQTGRQYGDLPFKSIHLPSLFRTQSKPQLSYSEIYDHVVGRRA